MSSAVVRVLEKSILQLLSNNLLRTSQHGFRSGRSVDTNLLEFYDHVTKYLDTGVPADMILLDFSKTFDKVCHKQLAIKLCAVKFEEKSLLWILDFLYMWSQYVQLFDDPVGRILWVETKSVSEAEEFKIKFWLDSSLQKFVYILDSELEAD